MNLPLVFGGVMSTLAALLHIAIIFGGSSWYSFFGASQEMVSLAEQGSWIPTIRTLGIFAVLFIWGLYAFSAAGLLRRFPLLKTALVIISSIYIIRGFAFIPVWFIKPDIIDNLIVWSSLLCLVIGCSYAIGTKQVWTKFSKQ